MNTAVHKFVNNKKTVSNIVSDLNTAILHQRYTLRDNAHARHLGHVLQEHYPPQSGDSLYYTMTRDEFYEKFMKRGMDSFECPGERLEIDTTDFTKVHPEQIVARVEKMLEG